MVWGLLVIFALWAGTATFFLIRASKRLLEFDELFQVIIDPMEEYAAALRKITTAEGLLHDHPEVLAFHRANMDLLRKIDLAITSVKENRPLKQEEPKGNPPEVV